MKIKTIILGVSLLFSFVSCEQETEYCLNINHNTLTTLILAQNQIDTIKALFSHNHLDYTNYQFYNFQRDELNYHHVKCYQFKNNLKLFTNDLIFHFNEKNNYYFLSGEIIENITLDTNFKLNKKSVVTTFIHGMVQNNDLSGEKEAGKNSCFDIEFGYYDLNYGNNTTSKNFTKTWKIKPTNKDYPYAYIDDKSSTIIYYDNGIRD